ncbi:MAG: hypothetical protein KBD15_00280 [Candidatus Magasanikbacteria bacterium]|nr:hypothetical protein [Candidatus Magasanikbacteria bacterium]
MRHFVIFFPPTDDGLHLFVLARIRAAGGTITLLELIEQVKQHLKVSEPEVWAADRLLATGKKDWHFYAYEGGRVSVVTCK